MLARHAGVCWIEARPWTGRTHQIRLHLAHEGIPILADPAYNPTHAQAGNAEHGMARQALHAAALEVSHPRSGKPLRFTAPAPPDFVAAMEMMGLARPRGELSTST